MRPSRAQQSVANSGMVRQSQSFALDLDEPSDYSVVRGHWRNVMKRTAVFGAIICAALAAPAIAGLQEGAKAPDFTAQTSLGGKEYSFSLADALKKGPVVLYFY